MSSQNSSIEEIVPTQNVETELANGHVDGNWSAITAKNYAKIPEYDLCAAFLLWKGDNKILKCAHYCYNTLDTQQYVLESEDPKYTEEKKRESLRKAVVAIKKLGVLIDMVDNNDTTDYWKAAKRIDREFETKQRIPDSELKIPKCFAKKADKKKVESKPKK